MEVQQRQVEVRRHLVEQEAGSWAFLSTPGSWAYGGIGSRGCAQVRSAEHARPRPEGAAAGVADPSRGDDAFVARNGGLGFTPSATIYKDLQGTAKAAFSPGWCYQPGLKKHTDRVFLSSACETLDQGCVSFEGL